MTTYFAKLNDQGLVEQVIVADADFVSQVEGNWVETFFDKSGVKPAGIGDGWNGSTFKSPPFVTSVWDSETKTWTSDETMYLWPGHSSHIPADGVSFSTIVIVSQPNTTINYTINGEAVTGVTNEDGGLFIDLSATTPGTMVVYWNFISILLTAVEM